MRKIAPMLALCLLLSGCWDYQDLNRLNIVSGIAFDTADDGLLKVTLEIVDRTLKQEDLRSRAITATVREPGEALRTISRQLDHRLYFGNTAIALFGKDVPYDTLIAWLRGEREVRETLYLAAAEEAGALLEIVDGGVAAFSLRDILDTSEEVKPVELYRAGKTLPYFTQRQESGEKGEDGKEDGEEKQPVLTGCKTVG